MKKLLSIVVLGLLWCSIAQALPKCQGENVFDWTDCIGGYVVHDGDYKAIDFSIEDQKKLLNPSFDEMKNFKYGTKYIGEMKNGYADGAGIMIQHTGNNKNFTINIYDGFFKKGRFETGAKFQGTTFF